MSGISVAGISRWVAYAMHGRGKGQAGLLNQRLPRSESEHIVRRVEIRPPWSFTGLLVFRSSLAASQPSLGKNSHLKTLFSFPADN